MDRGRLVCRGPLVALNDAHAKAQRREGVAPECTAPRAAASIPFEIKALRAARVLKRLGLTSLRLCAFE